MNTQVDMSSDREIVISRVMNAPRELVFKAWSDPKHVNQWWGPNGFTNTFTKFELKTGGMWVYTMLGPDGVIYPNWIKFEEVILGEKLVYSHGAELNEPAHFHVTVTFQSEGTGKTKVTQKSVFPSKEARDYVVENFGALEGGKQHIAKMEAYAKKLEESRGVEPFIHTRTFDASMELMFQLWTDPEHMKHWSGPKGVTIKYSNIDFRPGGRNHYCMVTPDGNEMWGLQVYREIDRPRSFVYVNSFSNEKGEVTRPPFSDSWPLEMLTTISFIEKDGKTTVQIEWLPINCTDEEIKTFNAGRPGMHQGWGGSLDKLEEYIGTLR